MTFSKWLESIDACLEACEWVGTRSAARAWADCEHGGWMLYLLGLMMGKPGWPSRRVVLLAACDCAGLVRKYWRGKVPGRSIRIARAWAAGRVSTARACVSARAAYDAAEAADAVAANAVAANDIAEAANAACAAANAAYAVAHAVSLSCDADDEYFTPADAAGAVAESAAEAAADATGGAADIDRIILRECARLVRKRVPRIPDPTARGRNEAVRIGSTNGPRRRITHRRPS